MRMLLCVLSLFALSGETVCALDMGQAVDQALSYNPQIQRFLALEQAAGSRAEKAEAPFWPSLEADYAYWTGERDVLMADDESSLASGRARYNLFNGGSDLARLRQADRQAEAAAYRRQGVVADVVLEVKQAYIEVLRAERTVETERKSVELLERQQHDSALRLREGLIARNDLLRVEVELATARQRLLRAEGDLQNARQTLARTLGKPLPEDENVADFKVRPAPPTLPLAELQQEMFVGRSELRYLRKLLASDLAGRRAVRGELLPDVDLVLSYERFGNNSLPQPGDPDYDSDSRAMLEATWTLFSGFDTHYELAARDHEIRARHREIKATQDRLTEQLQFALEELRVAEGNLETAITGLTQAEENYRVNENRYKARVATTVDLLDAQEFLTRARNEKLRAFYDFHRAAAVLERVLERGPKLSSRTR